MHPFEEYLKAHNLEALTVSLHAHVRYMTVWNATKGIPITIDHARKIRETVKMLTGEPYTASLVLFEPEPLEGVQTIPIKKIPRHNLN